MRGTGGRSLLKKLRKTFMKRGYGILFVQVHVLTNLSDPFPKKIVRERLTQSSAFYGERLRSFVYW